jgi:hypothetical protein
MERHEAMKWIETDSRKKLQIRIDNTFITKTNLE